MARKTSPTAESLQRYLTNLSKELPGVASCEDAWGALLQSRLGWPPEKSLGVASCEAS